MKTKSVLMVIVFKLNGNRGSLGLPVGPVEERGQDSGPATLATAPPPPLVTERQMKCNLNNARRLTKVKFQNVQNPEA